MMNLYDEFLSITIELNKELGITPILYGSLGMERLTGHNFSPDDIDILVPLIFLEEKWENLKQVVEGLGYELVDLHEHQFRKDNIELGIAFVEDLKPFADVDYNGLTLEEDSGARYYTLSASDYLKVYTQSLTDGYRRTKNNSKDLKKLQVLKELGRD